MANYLPDLEKMPLAQFSARLAGQELLPGRKILQEDMAARFAVIEAQGIQTLAGLIAALKTKKKVASFAEQTGLPVEYLTILRREANSYLPKPAALGKFPGVSEGLVSKLAVAGIKHSHDLIERCQTHSERLALAAEVGAGETEIVELLHMADLTRINGVGPVFARMLVDVGILTSEGLALAEDGALFSLLKFLNFQRKYTEANFTQEDIAYIIELAGLLPPAAEY